eukprot:1373011-Amorphochlora_amoeboformis.AAC.1
MLPFSFGTYRFRGFRGCFRFPSGPIGSVGSGDASVPWVPGLPGFSFGTYRFRGFRGCFHFPSGPIGSVGSGVVWVLPMLAYSHALFRSLTTVYVLVD